MKPIAPNCYEVRYTIDDAERERLNYLLQLLSHQNPRGSLSHLHRISRELLIDELENQKLGETDDPRPSSISPDGRYIPRHVRREVWKRDGGACTWVSPTGRRCGSRWLVEFDHIQAFALGGEPTVENVRLLCRTHNQLEADRAFGVEFMEEKRAAPEATMRAPQRASREADQDHAAVGVGAADS
jgi:5-methylcytosine-specific restriction endonuclease McrA